MSGLLLGPMWLLAITTSISYGQAADATGKIKVFILSGQSNMVGAGKVDGGSSRWGSQFLDPVVSVYEGGYDAKADYDSMKPLKSLMRLASFLRICLLRVWVMASCSSTTPDSRSICSSDSRTASAPILAVKAS